MTGPPAADDPRALPMLPDPLPPAAPASFHVLTKPTGAVCNLDCTYCFFLSKEALYPGSEFRMSDETHEQYVRQLLEAHQTEMVTIAWLMLKNNIRFLRQIFLLFLRDRMGLL